MMVLVLGTLLPGCTMQKRSIMPGWHVEFLGQKSGCEQPTSQDRMTVRMSTDARSQLKQAPSRAENVPCEAEGSSEYFESIDRMKAVASLNAQPVPHVLPNSLKQLHPSSGEFAPAPAVPNNIGFVRFLYFLFGLPLTFLGIIFILLAGWETGFLFVGLVSLIAGIAALKKAFTSRAKWLEPEDNPQTDINAQLRQARKNQHRRRIEERQKRRAEQAHRRTEARERRRERRHAFFQSAYARMAIGFFGILALYALLF